MIKHVVIKKKTGIKISIGYDFGKIKIDSYNSLPIIKNIDFS